MGVASERGQKAVVKDQGPGPECRVKKLVRLANRF
jgi:hypothetical protein